MIQAHVIYRGQVQGVGFRWNTANVAKGYEVTGYVKNLKDGSVEMIAEGEAQTVQVFLEAVASRMRGYIQDAQIQRGAATGAWPGFSIAR